MKKLLFISIIFLTICCEFVNSQTNQTKLNQVELMRKFLGAWQSTNVKDTVWTWEMNEYSNAIVQVGTSIIKGVKKADFTVFYTYDSASDNFNCFGLYPNGSNITWQFKFASDKEANLYRPLDEGSSTILLGVKNIFDDQDHVTVHYYNPDKVITRTKKMIRVGSGSETQTNEVTRADNQFSLAILNKDIAKMSAWYVDNSIMIFEDGTAENGKKEILNGWSTVFKDANFSVKRKLNDVKVPVNGVAYTIGSWERKQSNAEGKVTTVAGKYVESWVKQKDGSWKVLVINLK
jgi:ketosteroid isomerase-like protein